MNANATKKRCTRSIEVTALDKLLRLPLDTPKRLHLPVCKVNWDDYALTLKLMTPFKHEGKPDKNVWVFINKVPSERGQKIKNAIDRAIFDMQNSADPYTLVAIKVVLMKRQSSNPDYPFNLLADFDKSELLTGDSIRLRKDSRVPVTLRRVNLQMHLPWEGSKLRRTQ